MPPPSNSLLRLATKPISLSRHTASFIQTRHESTARRHKKLLALPEAPSYTPSTRNSPTLIFNPPSSAPSPYHTPSKFLPPSDKRSALNAAALHHLTHASLRTSISATARPGTPLSTISHLPPRPSSALPPPVRAPYEKKYHLTEADIEEMRKLRSRDPEKWTRVRLAEKFGCSQYFVGMVAKNGGKAERVEREHERSRARWGNRKRMAREDRGRRKEGWGRDE
ncbi:mitochondrial ribosomal protein subunit L20-domain-containing protein [Dendryphion nanum]|uniref:Mitochondrial ribosomal protein subunit L20-domain-containing protein n=1 Tax=Dendryphion nanum TaxID=256645 RepID=A0A9P9IYX7_9PLEO|nr:mitochondrial ribosomal protein subunit L20-domain-containing protein [Dendryphion nanum]